MNVKRLLDLSQIPVLDTGSEEVFEDLVKSPHVRIEKIISHGHSSPKHGWYDQDENEWVVVLAGHGRICFEQDNRIVELKAGDAVDIKAHQKHRVEWTTPDEPTIWLAVFY